MKTIETYSIGEEVLIKATVTNKEFDGDKVKYALRVSPTNNDIEHMFKVEEIVGPVANIDADDFNDGTYEDIEYEAG